MSAAGRRSPARVAQWWPEPAAAFSELLQHLTNYLAGLSVWTRQRLQPMPLRSGAIDLF
eukprot:CAMPEP_0206465126 /NCGR_PEP_ID=MMETSP0324_2-20121206/27636_1 /ASSEMBLY_ACC=CAM_ASM_000836 /TAXON_ID=2866 /ORGANISM="Crypthecodinium cohnii, Strain Seligo" /LENGTH=58 /DNA_ID=CAMNT_0053937909 /DNA_START=816 /DNA_END=989 /DNA_ORIENTATION=+